MYVCVCNAVNERRVRHAVDGGATTLRDLQSTLGVATCCGRCAKTAKEYLPGGAQGPAVAAELALQTVEVTRVAGPRRILQVA